MSTDILWLAERLHQDGIWEPIDCHAKAAFDAEMSASRSTLMGAATPSPDDPRLLFGMQDYRWFAILTGRSAAPQRRSCIAKPGQPALPSALAWPPDEDDGLQSFWFSLGDMRAAAGDDPCGVCLNSHDRKRVQSRLDALETIATQDDILVGPSIDEDGRGWPAMQDLSAHEQMTRKARAAGLTPVADDTVRVLIAYDD